MGNETGPARSVGLTGTVQNRGIVRIKRNPVRHAMGERAKNAGF